MLVGLKVYSHARLLWPPALPISWLVGDRLIGVSSDPATIISLVVTLFASLAGDFPDDPLIAFHYERLREGETGVKIKMTEK